MLQEQSLRAGRPDLKTTFLRLVTACSCAARDLRLLRHQFCRSDAGPGSMPVDALFSDIDIPAKWTVAGAMGGQRRLDTRIILTSGVARALGGARIRIVSSKPTRIRMSNISCEAFFKCTDPCSQVRASDTDGAHRLCSFRGAGKGD